VWYHQDNTFNLPHISVAIAIRSAAAYTSPETSALTTLLARTLADSLNSVTYEASSASLHFTIAPSENGLKVNMWGLSHKLPKLLDHVLEVMEHSCTKLTFERFSSLHEQLLRELLNYSISTPTYLRANNMGAIVSEVPRWESHECAEALKYVTLDRFKLYVKDFFRSVHFAALIAGNVSLEKAWSITDRVRRTLFDSSVVPMSPIAVNQVSQKGEVKICFVFLTNIQDSSRCEIRTW
jgi:secreted Zn-dependent insulinase-like peptidase